MDVLSKSLKLSVWKRTNCKKALDFIGIDPLGIVGVATSRELNHPTEFILKVLYDIPYPRSLVLGRMLVVAPLGWAILNFLEKLVDPSR